MPLFKIAGVYALLAASGRDNGPQSTRDADQAIDLLRQAVAWGFRRKDLITENPGFVLLMPRSDLRAIFDSLPLRVEASVEGEALKVVKTSGAIRSCSSALPMKRQYRAVGWRRDLDRQPSPARRLGRSGTAGFR